MHNISGTNINKPNTHSSTHCLGAAIFENDLETRCEDFALSREIPREISRILLSERALLEDFAKYAKFRADRTQPGWPGTLTEKWLTGMQNYKKNEKRKFFSNVCFFPAGKNILAPPARSHSPPRPAPAPSRAESRDQPPRAAPERRAAVACAQLAPGPGAAPRNNTPIITTQRGLLSVCSFEKVPISRKIDL